MGISNPDKKPLALIAGPTASGKTALALHLARRHDVTIINADSAQVYSALPVLSAQPTAEEMASAPHRLFGYLDGTTACSAARWAADARAEIDAAHEAGRVPVLVGGTGLYLRSLLEGIAPIPEVEPGLRSRIRSMDVDDAYAALQASDPAVAATLGPRDSARIMRALEVIEGTGRSIADWRRERSGGISADIALHPLILLPPRDWLYARCDLRFEAMMEQGAVDEVQALLGRSLPSDAPVLRAIGVPEIAAMLAGEIDRAECVVLGQTATRQYAKRQYTWFRNQSPADWTRCEQEVNDSKIDEFATLFQF